MKHNFKFIHLVDYSHHNYSNTDAITVNGLCFYFFLLVITFILHFTFKTKFDKEPGAILGFIAIGRSQTFMIKN